MYIIFIDQLVTLRIVTMKLKETHLFVKGASVHDEQVRIKKNTTPNQTNQVSFKLRIKYYSYYIDPKCLSNIYY